jgi:hypothetical protein
MPSPDETILREIAVEMADMEQNFARKMEAIRRKLKLALGDVKPRKPVVEFVSKDGKTRSINRRKTR